MSEPEHALLRTALNILIPCAFISSIVLIPVGVGLLGTDTTVTHVVDYSECQGADVEKACMATVGTRDSEHYSECVCRLTFELTQAIPGDVTLSYETDYDQTDAVYASSRDDSQLRGEPGAAPAQSCGYFSYNGGRPIFPCGELADSMFNDTFSSLKAEHEPEPYAVSYIGLLGGRAFHNPPPEVWDKFSKPKSWLSKKNNVWDIGSNLTGVENEAFQAWMNTSLKRKPVFRVLREGLPAGNHSIVIHIRSPLAKYGSKRFVLEGVSPRAQAQYAVAGAAALGAGAGAALLLVVLLVVAFKHGYYVATLRAVLARVLASIRTSRVVIGSAKILKTVAKNKSSCLRKFKRARLLPLIVGVGLVFISIGFLANIYTAVKTIHIEDYSDCHGTDVKRACVAKVTRNYTECVCSFTFELQQSIPGEVTLYYENDFDQTDAAYASSRDDSQLRGEPGAAPAQSCGDFSYNGGRPIYPCGELADSIFNDSFSNLKLDDESTPIVVSYTGLLPDDTAYHNPPEDVWNKFVKPKSWLFRKYNTWDSGSQLTGVENEAFRAWMDTSLKRKPVFRVVDPVEGLPAGKYTIDIHIRSFSEKYGSKKFVLEGVSWYVRWSYVAVGAVTLVAGVLVLLYDLALRLKNPSLQSADTFAPYAYTGPSAVEAPAENGNPPEKSRKPAPAANVIVEISEE